MRPIILQTLLLTATTLSSANAAVFSIIDNVISAIPDGSSAGMARSLSITAPVNETITNIDVSLNLSATSGGVAYLGDLDIYLTNGTQTAILTNRAGSRLGSTFGYDDNQFINVTFSTAGIHDFHNYRTVVTGLETIPLSAPLTGVWAADGRGSDPAVVIDTDARNQPLSGFNGSTANGTWSLFAADLSSGATHQVNSWGLTITTVPEPGTSIIYGLVIFGLLRRRR